MAYFYGEVRGRAYEKASRLGSKLSGMRATAASYGGAIHVELDHIDGQDRYRVYLIDWPSKRTRLLIGEGWLHQDRPYATEWITGRYKEAAE